MCGESSQHLQWQQEKRRERIGEFTVLELSGAKVKYRTELYNAMQCNAAAQRRERNTRSLRITLPGLILISKVIEIAKNCLFYNSRIRYNSSDGIEHSTVELVEATCM
jgi:hypothetical protein